MEAAEEAIERALKTEFSDVIPSLLLSKSEHSSASLKEHRKKQIPKASRKSFHQGKGSQATSGPDTWSTARSFHDCDISTLPTSIADEEEYVPNLIDIRVSKSHIRNVLSYDLYHFVNGSQLYNGKLTAQTSKHAMEMESFIKPRVFDNRDPMTNLRFFDQFKRPCRSKRVSEEMAL